MERGIRYGNAETERVMRTAKEIIWLNEFASFEEAKEKIGRWIHESRGV
jgi:hypothetical protein